MENHWTDYPSIRLVGVLAPTDLLLSSSPFETAYLVSTVVNALRYEQINRARKYEREATTDQRNDLSIAYNNNTKQPLPVMVTNKYLNLNALSSGFSGLWET